MRTFAEYKAVRSFYGDRTAKRTKLPYINHIDEALLILEWRGASELTMRAYCLHPLFQGDADLSLSWQRDLSEFDPHALVLAMEYRSIANGYLSRDVISAVSEIRLSPLAEVNEMLVADKIQNRKDFELHFHGPNERISELQNYFSNWLQRLDVDESTYQETRNRLIAATSAKQ
ncbi:MAG: hypothetical protein JNM27_03315 [Leptospirales bacterium]|nr:hypothetical protein [Leptospirales bacterium]